MGQWDADIEIYKKQLEELLNSESHDFDAIRRKEIPNTGGVYIIFDKEKSFLYVGQSKRLRGRLVDDHLKNDKKGSAFRRNLSEGYHLATEKEITQYISANCSFKYIKLDKPKLLEYFVISLLKPKFNK